MLNGVHFVRLAGQARAPDPVGDATGSALYFG